MDKSTQIPPDSFAARLKQAMAMRNLKQETLAEAAGVSQNTIHKLTSGKAQSTRKLIEIAAALGVSPVWLQTGEGAPAARSAVSVADGSPLVLEPLHPWDATHRWTKTKWNCRCTRKWRCPPAPDALRCAR